MPPFDFKLAFSNLERIWVWLLQQSCRTLNLEQLLFFEIFEFPYKLESNLRNEASGILVNTLNSASRQTPTIGELPPASTRVRECHLLLRCVCVAVTCRAHLLPPPSACLITLSAVQSFSSLLCFFRHRRLAPSSSRRSH